MKRLLPLFFLFALIIGFLRIMLWILYWLLAYVMVIVYFFPWLALRDCCNEKYSPLHHYHQYCKEVWDWGTAASFTSEEMKDRIQDESNKDDLQNAQMVNSATSTAESKLNTIEYVASHIV